MTIANMRRKWPQLIKEVEREEHKKFIIKPSLRLFNGRPMMERWIRRKKGKVVRAKWRVSLNRRMCRDEEKYAILTAKHELREALLEQHGYSKSRSHIHCKKREKKDMRKLGLTKSYGWFVRTFWR